HEFGELFDPGAELVGDLTPLRACGADVLLGERGADEGRDHPAPLLAGMRHTLRMKCTRQRCHDAFSTLACLGRAITDDVRAAGTRRSGRAHVLWTELPGPVAARR